MPPFFRKVKRIVGEGWGKVKRGLAEGERRVRPFVTDPFGFRNIGENIPTSFTLSHKINIEGKIEVSASVSVDVNIDVALKMPDLVTAASNIKDGLKEFDIFGGAFRRLIEQIDDAYNKKS